MLGFDHVASSSGFSPSGGKNAYAWNFPARVVSVTPYLNFCASTKAAEKYYYESCRMALLAFVALPNVDWSTAHELTHTLQDTDVEKSPNAFVAEEPRAGLPHQDHHWGDCPAFLRASWNSAKAVERDFALASSKKADAEFPPPQGGSIRLLTWGIWESGPLYDARLRTIAQVISGKYFCISRYNFATAFSVHGAAQVFAP